MNSRDVAMENWNYYRDPRVVATFLGSVLEDVNLRDMTAVFEGDEEEPSVVRLKFEVCPACHGTAKMVDPNFDAGGLCQEDIEALEYDDPGFMERYKRGGYDVNCSTCKGKAVVPGVDRANTPKAILKAFEQAEAAERSYASMCAMERAMGC